MNFVFPTSFAFPHPIVTGPVASTPLPFSSPAIHLLSLAFPALAQTPLRFSLYADTSLAFPACLRISLRHFVYHAPFGRPSNWGGTTSLYMRMMYKSYMCPSHAHRSVSCCSFKCSLLPLFFLLAFMISSRIGTEHSPFSRTAPFLALHSHSAEHFPITSHSRIPVCIDTYPRLVIFCASLLASRYIYTCLFLANLSSCMSRSCFLLLLNHIALLLVFVYTRFHTFFRLFPF